MRLAALTLLVFFGGGEAQGTITKLLKKRKIAVIDDGDVSKGDKVCFYSASDRKRACGRVVKVKEDKSYVKITSKKRFRRLKKGMAHEVSTGSSGSGGGMQAEHSFTFRLLYTPGFMARAKFNYLDSNKKNGGPDGPFLPFKEEDIETGDSSQSKMARMFPWGGGGAEAEVFITPTLSIAMGGRYTLVNVSPRVTYDFLEANSRVFMRSDYSGHELNFWLDFFPLHVADLGLRLGAGGEFTMSSLSLSTDLMEDEEGETTAPKEIESGLFAGKSAANIMSVRLSARKDFPMGAFGFGLGVTAIISPVALSSKFTLEGDPKSRLLNESEYNKEKMIEDIENAIAHTNNIFSLVLGLSLYFSM